MKDIARIFSSFIDPKTIEKLLRKETILSLTGLSGSSQACALAVLLDHFIRKRLNIIVITPSISGAEDLMDDMATFGFSNIGLFVPWDINLDAEYTHDRNILSANITLLKAFRDKHFSPVIFSINALLQPVPSINTLSTNDLTITQGDDISPEQVTNMLIQQKFESSPMIGHYGEFSKRGGILDIFPYGSETPFRIEFFGDTVESVRTFSLRTQESLEEIDSCVISRISSSSIAEEINSTHSSSIADHLEKADMLIQVNTLEIKEKGDELASARKERRMPFFSLSHVLRKLSAKMTLHITGLPFGDTARIELPPALSNTGEFGFAENPVKKIGQISLHNKVFICCQNSPEEKRLTKLLENSKAKNLDNITLFAGEISSGFTIPSKKLTVATTREIFNRYKTRRKIHKSFDPSRFKPVSEFYALSPGDYVVHLSHGIGIFREIKMLEKNGIMEEYLTLEYANKVKLYVPARNINVIQKYIGGTRDKPQLDRLGSQKWEKRKKRAVKAIQDTAEELLRTQVVRTRNKGIKYPADTDWQHEFEASFIYEDTPDQVDVLQAIKKDMESNTPMDRLLCGDVGFGKTEIAVRIAFKVALSGKQTAVLCPTTILAQQHYHTFRERMAEYPVRIDSLSRFKSKSQQKLSVEKLKLGETDVIIGTHRLLSNDIGFKDLGLLIIDEEQRFGVMHKERLKRFRRTVDILTLTATPIPRTLHLSLLGIKDISSLRTPPEQRKPILTRVTAFSDRVIREAITTELNRNGQVYFIHNRVKTIDYFVRHLKKLVPEARVSKMHGQMHEKEIENEMMKFLNRETDVLVCTTIIESGIDLPNVNTLIINNAHNFGLADLHQLRGRVGRFTRQAYAYLLIPQSDPVSAESAKRLRTIEHYSELGAGFQIALQDLEIRGTGNILGIEQSGHISSIGYDLYCRILAHSVKGIKSDRPGGLFALQTEVSLNVSAYIPESYIRDFRTKLEVYKKIHTVDTTKQLTHIKSMLKDRFGDVPDETLCLIKLQEIAVEASEKNISKLLQKGRKLRVEFSKDFPSLTVDIPPHQSTGSAVMEFTAKYVDKL